MFETLMRYGGYRIDYINSNAAHTSGAFGFYVRGDLPENAVYSTAAKRHLVAGLNVIRRELGPENLVGVYLDVAPLGSTHRAAYKQLKQDLRAGLFRKVFVYQSCDLLGSPEARADLETLSAELGGIDLIVYDAGYAETMSLSRDSLLWTCEFEKVME